MGDFHAEIESIRTAASSMTNGPIASAQSLVDTMDSLDSYVVDTDWSEVSSCLGFGTSFAAAVQAYKKVAQDMLADAQAMQTKLNEIATQYETSDADARASLEAAIAGLGNASFMTDDPGSDAFENHQGDLESDNPEQAPAQPDGDTASDPSPSRPAPTTTGGGRTTIE